VEALKRGVAARTAEIFNSDQGSQFTSEKFTASLGGAQNRDQHGRAGPFAWTTLHRAVVGAR